MCAFFCQISENSVSVDYIDLLKKINDCDFIIQLIGMVDWGIVVAEFVTGEV